MPGIFALQHRASGVGVILSFSLPPGFFIPQRTLKQLPLLLPRRLPLGHSRRSGIRACGQPQRANDMGRQHTAAEPNRGQAGAFLDFAQTFFPPFPSRVSELETLP